MYRGGRRLRKRDRNAGEGTSRRRGGGMWNMRDTRENSSLASDGTQDHAREKPPPGLRGREIGMWYKRRSDERKAADPNHKMKKKEMPPIPVELSPSKQLEIRCLLDKIGMAAPSCVRKVLGEDTMPEDKYSHVEDSDFKHRFLKSITGSLFENMMGSASLDMCGCSFKDEKYKEQLKKKSLKPEYVNMLNFRKKLPAYDKQHEILKLINDNQVILVSGETGCGKTTQVPQFILDQEIEAGRGSTCRIVCTQPRRISAISVAERVASERAEPLGESVGFHIRLERTLPRSSGSIVFCTNGIVLQYMVGDPALREVSHIILDEIHERDTVSDFLITILKDVISMRRDLKVILMSATLNAEQFSRYFDNCPSINIPGFTFPVKEYYLEDVLQVLRFRFSSEKRHRKGKDEKDRKDFIEPWLRDLKRSGKYSDETLNSLMSPESEDLNMELMYELILYICTREPPGAILVFLPGWDKISSLNKLLTTSGKFPSSRFSIIPLHSMMPTVTQKSIFHHPPPGVRKIVIATNIAETSITIDDIVYVIDCGKIKMKNYDIKNNISTLQEEWVSLANAKQRRGRAGRVQEGICYHLFTRGREMLFENYQLPEMLRTRLEEVILQAKILQVGLAGPFLNKVLNPPDERAVEISLSLLKSMNALDEDEQLTPLGYHLAQLPMDPQAGKMILFAAMFGCLEPITSVAASLTFKDAFVIPLGKEKEVDRCKLELAQGVKSDHILMAEVMKEWEKAERKRQGYEFANYYFLSRHTLELLRDIKKQFSKHLSEMNFLVSDNVKEPQSNVHSEDLGLLKAIICSGLYPNVAVIRKVSHKKRSGETRVFLVTPEGESVKLHPKSVNDKFHEFESRLMVYHLKLKSSQIYLHDTSLVFPLALIFFCHNYRLEDDGDRKLIIINDIVKFSCSNSTAQLIQELRAWLDWLLEYKVSHPGVTDWDCDSDETYILRAIIGLISTEHQMYSLGEESDSTYSDQ